MTLPGYAAAASLYTTSRSYRQARLRPAGSSGPTLIAQHDPCAMPGSGGGIPIPRCCPLGTECRCGGRCVTQADGSVECVHGECLTPTERCR
jgi:hypothetical protein